MKPRKVPSRASKLALSILCGPLFVACGDQSSKIEQAIPPPAKKLSELKQSSPDMSPEELKAARKAAGFKSREEVAAENAAMFEADARKYVKERLKDYRTLLADVRKSTEAAEKAAQGWAKSKDVQAAVDKHKEKVREANDELTKRYNELTGHGAEGGETQVLLGKAFRGWEDLQASLGPDVAAEALTNAANEIRSQLDEVGAKLDEIEKDPGAEPVAKAD